MKAYYFDSHKTFKPFYIEQEEGESEREFDRRTWRKFLELSNERDGWNGSGNTTYMRKIEDNEE